MPEYLEVEPDELRKIAKQHDRVAANVRKWGEIPHVWLAEFKTTYGAIADPMRTALVDYYNRRHDSAERLATNHERTRDELIAAAKSMEDADQSGRHHVAHAGGLDHRPPPSGPGPGGPTGPTAPGSISPDAPIVNGTQPWQHSATTPDDSGMPEQTGRSDQTPLPLAASAPQTHDTAPVGAAAPTWATSPSVGIPAPAADLPAMPAFDANSGAGMAGGMHAPLDPAPLDTGPFAAPVGGANMAGGMPAPLDTNLFAAPVGGANMAGGMPAPLATGPFTAAIHAARNKQTLPPFVVGEQVDEDFVLARTLLAATLAAVADSAFGLEWAVAVLRTPVGPLVLLTSTEGRGWLPPGLFLPSEVTHPWRWDVVLNTAAREAIAALEGTTDPARMLAEFGLKGRVRRVRISALVSSAAIPDNLRTALGDDVAVAGQVSAAESDVDLTSPGVGLVDRLALAGSDELLRQAMTVPEAEIRAKCLELARAADAQVRIAVSGIDGEISTHRAQRQRIFDALNAGQSIPASWWDQIRAADDMTAAALRSRRVDVSHVPVGGVRLDVSGTEGPRGMVFERRADELLLLLAAGEPDRQTLRDAFYTYGQIIEHPLFPAAARAVAPQAMKTTGTASAVLDFQAARNIAPGVSSSGRGGPPPSIAELLKGPAASEGSSEQRRV